MDNAILHRTGMHKGFLLGYALMNGFALSFALLLTVLFTLLMRPLVTLAPAAAYNYMRFVPLLFIMVPVLVGWIPVLITYRKTLVTFTSDRVSFNTGFFFRTEGQLSWRDVESVFVQRGPIGLICGYGTLVLVGTAGTPFCLRFMPQFESLREIALSLSIKQRGLPLEQKTNVIPDREREVSIPCSSCGRATTPRDRQVSGNSAGRFGGKMVCSECQRFAPPSGKP